MGYLNKDITLEMLYDRKLMSKKSFTVCKQIVKDPTLENIINFYNAHGTFIKVRYCGPGTNAELVNLCKNSEEVIEKYRETLFLTRINKNSNNNTFCNS